jgi:hypothetical protein
LPEFKEQANNYEKGDKKGRRNKGLKESTKKRTANKPRQ